MSFSAEQLILLNNLMYMASAAGPFPELEDYTGKKLGDYIRSISLEQIVDPDPDNLRMTTAQEWRNIVRAAMKETRLMNMRILTVYTDLSEGGGACRSAVFVSSDSADACVVFKGTELVIGSAQWKDNFISGNVTDTPHQIKALAWYREVYRKYHLEQFEVTVTGHSKGGNKAKYVTVLDPSVDHCVSFDGEGFSDQFFTKYGVEILRSENKIENHCVDYDYISPLLNDIGRTVWYYGNNYGIGGFAENHLANTFMRFDDDGNFWLDVNEDGQPAEMKAMDEFANSYLRSMNEKERSKALSMLNELLNAVLSLHRSMTGSEIVQVFLEMADDPDRSRHISYFLAYLIRYEQKYPVTDDLLRSVLTRFDLEGIAQYVELVASLINWKAQILWISLRFDHLASAVSTINTHAPKWVYRKLAGYLEKKNLFLREEQIRKLADIVEMADSYMKTIVIYEDGMDRSVHLARI